LSHNIKFDEHVNNILTICNQLRWLQIVKIFWSTGPRWSEIADIQPIFVRPASLGGFYGAAWNADTV